MQRVQVLSERCQQGEVQVGATRLHYGQLLEAEKKQKGRQWENEKITVLEKNLPEAVAKSAQFPERAMEEEWGEDHNLRGIPGKKRRTTKLWQELCWTGKESGKLQHTEKSLLAMMRTSDPIRSRHWAKQIATPPATMTQMRDWQQHQP